MGELWIPRNQQIHEIKKIGHQKNLNGIGVKAIRRIAQTVDKVRGIRLGFFKSKETKSQCFSGLQGSFLV